jgi:phosphopantothenoylcysteine decarboxylase/phosphopantothenate--cysteine ligase
MTLAKKHILLCVTGGIAAYKAIDLASMLIKQKFEVKTILTSHALKFVSELSFQAITKNTVHTVLFSDPDPIPHISLADWADLIVVAPATANIMAKAAHGIADDLLSTVLLANTKPVLWIPAMNVHMLAHPATQTNLALLKERGNYILEPQTGMLACGYEGKGKYPPNEEVIYAIKTYLERGQDCQGKKILISAGATAEPIDAMRTITNLSSGKMGIALARCAALRGAKVFLVYGQLQVALPHFLEAAISAPTVLDMQREISALAKQMDIIIMAAAVSDFTIENASAQKIKKTRDLTLQLIMAPDVLAGLGTHKSKAQKLIGFAAETENLISNALEKLEKKNLDMIVANHLSVCGLDNTEITLMGKELHRVCQADKFSAAQVILDEILLL